MKKLKGVIKIKKVLLLDICDTLYKSNTTFDFLDFYFAQNRNYLKIKEIKKNIIIKIINKIIYKLLKKDLIRVISTKLLKNISKDDIDIEIEKFFENFLKNKEKKNVLQLVQKYKEENYTVIIISGTYDFIAKKIAEKIEVDFVYATNLEIEKEQYTGKILLDMLIKKEEILREIIKKEQISSICLITDNITDYQLVKYTKKTHVVLTDNNKKFWNSKKNKEKIFFLKEGKDDV